MPRYRQITPAAWQVARIVLLRYPESKREYDSLVEISQTNTSEHKGGAKPVHSDPTATAAIRLHDDAYYQRVKREVAAVDAALEGLDDAERRVIQKRFWSRRGKTLGYRYIHVGYSEREMHRIVTAVIRKGAYNLGER